MAGLADKVVSGWYSSIHTGFLQRPVRKCCPSVFCFTICTPFLEAVSELIFLAGGIHIRSGKGGRFIRLLVHSRPKGDLWTVRAFRAFNCCQKRLKRGMKYTVVCTTERSSNSCEEKILSCQTNEIKFQAIVRYHDDGGSKAAMSLHFTQHALLTAGQVSEFFGAT
uniref:Uncharacterized protein n=1 Tax=Branchiostoma floridae TaxID=7739 RepID=C3Z638_BRAFL|eukprot:XP_002595952.1 hypothetical protein BRAFLDRAFT_96723 [Branchiostoma floridae]